MVDSYSEISKIRLFIENFLIYGLGGIISKLIPLIMLPIVTRLIPNTSYLGISDLSNTVTSFGSALAILGMYDAMYRMFFEKNDENYKRKVCSTTLLFTIGMSLIVTTLIIISRDAIAKYFFGDIQYSYLVYITAATIMVSSTNQIVSAPSRMQNKRKIYLITNIVNPIVSYSISIPLILTGHYIIALPIAALISGATMEITFGILNNNWFKIELFDRKILKQLLIIAVPLFPNFLIYWIFNSSDRVMITNLINVEAAGVYSVGARLGHCSQLIYTAFAGGWQYFAFSTMRADNQVESNSKVFEYLGIISFIASVFVFALSRLIFDILFTDDYILGYIVAPYLFMAPLMQMLFQVICNQSVVIKKTWPNMFILLGGASINIILNFILIPTIGIEGAAIATLVGYICSNIIGCIAFYRMKLMIISRKFVLSFMFVIIYVLFWRLVCIRNTMISLVLACFTVMVISSFYKTEIVFAVNKLKNRKIK